MTLAAGGIVRGNDLILPDRVSAHANGVNTITATSFTDLPTIACAVSITNPHATANMLVKVDCGAWINTSTIACRVCPRISGALTVAAGIGSNAPTGYGQLIRALGDYEQYSMGYYVELPSGTSTFTVQAYRESASTTVQVNYATLDINPLRYIF